VLLRSPSQQLALRKGLFGKRWGPESAPSHSSCQSGPSRPGLARLEINSLRPCGGGFLEKRGGARGSECTPHAPRVVA
jgi:hypothetical protein